MPPPRRPYATDLTDAEWQLLAPLIPPPKPGGRPPVHDRRELVNAMAYWLRAGCAWRLLPHDLPPWQTVDHSFRSWRQQACGNRSTPPCAPRSGCAKAERPRPARPSWTANGSRPPSGGRHGYDGAKRVNGRKRHLLVDTLGLVIKVQVTAADVGDRDGAMALLRRLDRRRFPRLRHGWADAGDRGPFLDWTREHKGITFQVVSRSDGGRSRAGSRLAPRRRSCPRSRWSPAGGWWSGPSRG